jgi:hypothetical protein
MTQEGGLSLGTKRDSDAPHPGGLNPEQLALRLFSVVAARRPEVAQAEAADVIGWALGHLDARVVDSVIGEAVGWGSPPALPRAVAKVIEQRARSLGVSMPPYQPKGRRTRSP